MSELKFSRKDNEKHGTLSITITHGVLPLKGNFEIIENARTKWNYRKAVIQLTPDQCETIEKWETQINEYLKNQGVGPVKFLYGNRIYPRTHYHKRDATHGMRIRPSGIWVNYRNKPHLQYWLECKN